MSPTNRGGLRPIALGFVLLTLCSCQGGGSAVGTAEPATEDGKETAVITETHVTKPGNSQPASEPTQERALEGSPEGGAGPLKITILYDNYSHDPRLKSAWGFAALVETGERTLLFDTGEDGPILLSNMRLLGIDPTRIEAVVLSHIHGDHVGGLGSVLGLGMRPVVYLLPSFPQDFKARVQQRAEVVEVSPGLELAEGVFSTGEMGSAIAEQALVVRREQGLVILTGCAHPGVVPIVQRAKELFADPVHLVMGGFHLRDYSTQQLVEILAQLRGLEVERVAPCHCTGDHAIQMFWEEYGEDFIQAGVGQVIQVGP